MVVPEIPLSHLVLLEQNVQQRSGGSRREVACRLSIVCLVECLCCGENRNGEHLSGRDCSVTLAHI